MSEYVEVDTARIAPTPGVSLRRGPVALVVALLLLLAGCGSSSDDSAFRGEASTSPSPSSSVRVPSPTPTVEPADGPLIETEGATIRGLKTYKRIADYGAVQGYRDDQSFLTFAFGFTDKPSLDAFAKQHERIAEERAGDVRERVDDVVVAGKYNAFHFLDTTDPEEESHVFGLLFLNGSWTIQIGFYNEKTNNLAPLAADERQQVIDSILASFEPTYN